MIVLFFYFGKGFRVLCKRLPIMASIICIVDVEIPITPILLCARNPEGLFRDARFIPKGKTQTVDMGNNLPLLLPICITAVVATLIQLYIIIHTETFKVMGVLNIVGFIY